MTMKDDALIAVIGLAILGLLIALLCAIWASGRETGVKATESEAVKRGYGQYVLDSDGNGPVFKWIEPVTE